MSFPQSSHDSQDSSCEARDRFRQIGDAAGRDVVTRLEKNARRVIKDLIASLQHDLVSVRAEASLRPEQESADEVTPELEQDLDDLAPLVDQLRDHFEIATREWNELVQAFDEVRSETAESTFESVFGGLFEESPDDTATAESEVHEEDAARRSEEQDDDVQDTPPLPPLAAAAALDEGGSEDEGASAGPSPRTDEEDDTPTDELGDDKGSVLPEPETQVLEDKLDDLLLLVRDHVAKRDHGNREAAIPEGWTHRVAKEVAHRLRESMPVSPPSTATHGDDSAAAATTSKRISIDDVAAMIDEITGRNC